MNFVLNGITGTIFLLGIIWTIRALLARNFTKARRVLEGTSSVVVVLALVVGWAERDNTETYAKIWLAALLLAWLAFACSLKIMRGGTKGQEKGPE